MVDSSVKGKTWTIAILIGGSGVILIGIAQIIPEGWTPYEINIASAVANLGSLLTVTALIQFLFDVNLRKSLIAEVVSYADIFDKGLARVALDSKKVDYSSEIVNSSKLIVGCHYSPRIFENFFDDFKSRVKKRRHTVVLLLDEESDAASFLHKSLEADGHPREKQEKLRSLIARLDPDGEYFDIQYFRSILRYSFFKSDSGVWVKHAKNAKGFDTIPALFIRSGSPLFEFYSRDISEFMEVEGNHE